MKLKKLTLIAVLCLSAWTAGAETLRLNSGESLDGKIRAMDEQTLYLESKLTSQQLKIDRTDLRLIEFDATERSLARRLGIGLHYRPYGNEENLSIKNWLNPTDAAELIVGYSEGTQDKFNFELRLSRVFINESNSDLSYGAGAGLVSVDSSRGTSFRIFSGLEFFPQNNPNIGYTV